MITVKVKKRPSVRRDFDRDGVVEGLPLRDQLRYGMADYQMRTDGLLTNKETHTEVHGPVITSTRCVTSQKIEVLTYTAEQA